MTNEPVQLASDVPGNVLGAKSAPADCFLSTSEANEESSAFSQKRQSAAAFSAARTSRCEKSDDISSLQLTALESFPQAGSLQERFCVNPFLMAPMAGVSDAAWRYLARKHGAALAYTEMVSVAGLHFGGDKTWELVEPAEFEPDIAVQLFGRNPALFEEAAARVSERLGNKLSLLDINMACPVPKVTRKGEGSALLDEPELAAQIVNATRKGCSDAVPVTVKMRRGRRSGEECAPEFAARMEEAGASAVVVHGRFATQLYRGEASWECVSRVVDAVSIPIIGSGDVHSAERAVSMLETTGAAAVMIARGSYGNPWVFEDAQALLAGETPITHNLEEKLNAFREHIRLLEATGAHIARARSFAGWYLKGAPHAATWRNRAMSCSSAEDFLQLADDIEAALSEQGV